MTGMKFPSWGLAVFIATSTLGWGQSATREWTSVDGKKLTAEYLGVQGTDVVLKLAGGKISQVPLSRLSPGDNAFTRENPLVHYPAWNEWPPDADAALQNVPLEDRPGEGGTFVYTTPHFRFISNVNLGPALMKDLARVFELTHHLHSRSPFGILAQPADGLFNAKLFGEVPDYRKAGGQPNTAGIYLLREKVFMAPLDLMGVRAGSTGWRKEAGEYDVSTIIHELTHMLTHDMLESLPLWVNEGYAEYISNIPLEKGSFQTSKDKIREGLLDMLVRQNGIESAGSRRVVGMGERIKLQKGNGGPPLRKVASVLGMTNDEWLTGIPPGGPAPVRGAGPLGGRFSTDERERLRLPILYRTSHLVLYYFLQIEGEKGVLRIRRFLDENRKYMASYRKYRGEFEAYEAKMEEFLKLPGVTRNADGRVQYPSGLEFPIAPEAPFTDPNQLRLGGIEALLAGESPAVLGAKIEEALRQDLGVKLRFE